MIIDVKKFLFVGVREEVEHFFSSAQSKGFIEFIPTKGKRVFHPTPAIEKLIAALKILRKLPPIKQEERRDGREKALRIADEVILHKAQSEKLHEDIRVTQAEIVRVGPIGDFLPDDLDFIQKHGHRVVQFFCMKCSKREEMEDRDELIYLGTEYDLDYYISVSPEPIRPSFMMEMKIDVPVGQLKENLHNYRADLHQVEMELKDQAKYIDYLHEILIEELNGYNLAAARNEVAYPIDNSLFVIEAWVPSNKVTALFGLVQDMAIHAEPIVIEEADRVPTYMENRGLGKVGEDLIHIYDTPSITDKDPSRWVLFAFCVFFAMIISDAGYGLIFLALGLYLKFKKPPLKALGRRFTKLVLLLAVSCIFWGIITTSYFGLTIMPHNSLSKVSIVNYLADKKADYHFQAKDDVYQNLVKEYPVLQSATNGRDFLETAIPGEKEKDAYPVLTEFRSNVLLEFSLLVGVIHIGLSLLRNLRRNWAGIGWLIFMVGGYLYFPSMLPATSLVNYMGWVSVPVAKAVGLQMVYVGFGIAVGFALIQRRLAGLTEAMHVIAVFANILSYLRLYALALAATIMAETFNELGVAVGLAVGFLIIFLGHCMNLMIATMSGTIHGLRLNFLEWYHYSFEGGGRLFAPLLKLKAK